MGMRRPAGDGGDERRGAGARGVRERPDAVVCFSNWPRMILWLLRPVDWLLTGRMLW
jgi:hypothetical protein